MSSFASIHVTLRTLFTKNRGGGIDSDPPGGSGLTRAPMQGYSRTLHADGVGVVSPPPAICQSAGRILDPKTRFDSSGFELSEYVARLYLNVTDDVTGRVKCQIFDNLSLPASPGKAAVSH